MAGGEIVGWERGDYGCILVGDDLVKDNKGQQTIFRLHTHIIWCLNNIKPMI